MTDNDVETGADLGIGERAERERKRRFWTTLGLISVVGMPLGFILGTGAARNPLDPGQAFASFPPAMVVAFLVLSVGAFCWGTWKFAKSVDEVEIVDNLWGSTVGFYAYVMLLPIWWILARAGLAGEPQQWTIFLASMAAGIAAYGWRKWRAR